MQLLVPARFVVVGDRIAYLGKWHTITSFDWNGQTIHFTLDGTVALDAKQDEHVRVISSAPG